MPTIDPDEDMGQNSTALYLAPLSKAAKTPVNSRMTEKRVLGFSMT
jgi:hypothetical protein